MSLGVPLKAGGGNLRSKGTRSLAPGLDFSLASSARTPQGARFRKNSVRHNGKESISHRGNEMQFVFISWITIGQSWIGLKHSLAARHKRDWGPRGPPG